METQQQGVEDGIVAAAAGGEVDRGELAGGERAAVTGQPPRFGDSVGRAGAGVDEIVGDDDMFPGVAAVAAGASRAGGGGRGALHGLDLAGRDLIQSSGTPGGGHPIPVTAIGPVRAGPRRCPYPRQILTQGRHHTSDRLGTLQLGESDPELVQQLAGRSNPVALRTLPEW
jgi:hypothetical protein